MQWTDEESIVFAPKVIASTFALKKIREMKEAESRMLTQMFSFALDRCLNALKRPNVTIHDDDVEIRITIF